MKPSQLKVGSYVYRLTFADPEQTVPGLSPVVYVGENVLDDDREADAINYYFQDSASFNRFGLATEATDTDRCLLMRESPQSLRESILTLEEAADLLSKLAEQR